MLGIQDSAFRDLDTLTQGREAKRDGERAAIARELRHAYLVDSWGNSIANPERQQGVMKGYKTLERELREILPNLTIREHPGNAAKAIVYLGETKLFPTERLMPEFSVWITKTTETPIIYDGEVSLDADAMKVTEIPWNEVARGWRTVLLRLITQGYVSEARIERKFGPVDRPSWALYTGKQKDRKGVI